NIKQFITKLENPQVYTGCEINAVQPELGNPKTIDICLVFPDTYEIGMSHYGLKILYHLLNSLENVNAERCFLPTRASIAVFKEHNMPLFSLESKRPLKDFDCIGFSLLSEATFTNVLQVLEMAQIPLFRAQRETGGSYPVIAAGGISVANPEPMRDFVDIFGIGDGEVLFPAIAGVLKEIKAKQPPRQEVWPLFDKLAGVYVPACAPLKKEGRFYRPRVTGDKIRKQVAPDFETSASIPEHKIIVPITNVVFNRMNVEIARGCPQNCRFCQAKSYYSPFRSKTVKNTMTNIQEGLKRTGFDAFSLASLSTGDYPGLEELLPMIPRVISKGTSFSVPSLRPSTLSEKVLSTLALFRRTGLTIVPEAGTERLRKVVNKNVTDQEIFQAVDLALRHNWQKIKLYFMIGLPTETMEDIEGIVVLIGKIKALAAEARKKVHLHVSFSSFVPKPHTPLQWAAREDMQEITKKIHFLKDKLRYTKRIDIDVHQPGKGQVETILARGDYRVGQLLYEAFKEGEIFSAWDSDFRFEKWRELIEGTEYEDFLLAIEPEQPLPWDFLEVNFKPEYLAAEYRKSTAEQETLSCSQLNCGDCKGCFYGMKRTVPAVTENPSPGRLPDARPTSVLETPVEETVALPVDESVQQAGEEPVQPPAVVSEPVRFNKTRLYYRKEGNFVNFSHLSIIKYVERLIRRTGIRFKCSEGFHPRMKIIALPPLPVFALGLKEVMEIYLDHRFTEAEILERLNELESGFRFEKVQFANDSRVLSKDIHFLHLQVYAPGFSEDEEKMRQLAELAGDTDVVSWQGDTLVLAMDYAHNGQERFAKIYKLIDPEKQLTHNLTRSGITFKPLLPPVR
ncbi:MAG: TIGR03960 family B12-binding radical SAM protein, partial [bacterium]|nr:TIGR03960 family B12-binding radical SAM protein [bacterium]